MAQGHLIPIIDMAKLFASRGVRATIITTTSYLPLISETIEKSKELGTEIDHLIIKLPIEEVGLPKGCESLGLATTPEMLLKFLEAISKLGPQLAQLLEKHKPNCLVADMFFPWATDVAAQFGIPRLIFHGTSHFSLCAALNMYLYEPYKKISSSDTNPFVIPNLPGEITITRDKLPEFMNKQNIDNEFSRMFKASKEVELRSFGVLVNSFYELEQDYANHYTKFLGVRSWHIGPLFLWDKSVDIENKAKRGVKTSIDENYCLKWLDSKKPNSVIYVCFGSMPNFTDDQLKEIALALESYGQQFIWVVRKKTKNEGDLEDKWLPQGFENRTEGKGLIIREWAPQVLILEHEAIGGFVTHCGWNSILEAICAGVPLVTWPLGAEQFYNEKLITQILRIGVCVGAQKWNRNTGDFVKSQAIEKAVIQIMKGVKAEEMRNRVGELKEMARRAVKEGGSSYSDLSALIEELKVKCFGCGSSEKL